MSHAILAICETDNEVLLDGADERVHINHNKYHGDWNIVHEHGDGAIDMPGAVYHRDDAIIYGMHLLGALEDTEISPVEQR